MSPHQVATPPLRPLKLTPSPANLPLPLEEKSSPPHALPPPPLPRKTQKTSVLSFLNCKKCPAGVEGRKLREKENLGLAN